MKINLFYESSFNTNNIYSMGFVNYLTLHAQCDLVCMRKHNEIAVREGSLRKKIDVKVNKGL